MRHRKKGRKLGLKKGPRKAFLRILLNNFIQKERIVTTEARAKEIRPMVERLVAYGKKQNLAALKLLIQKLPKSAAYKIYHEIAPRYANRNGGCTRIIKNAKAKKHDGSNLAIIEFV